MNLAGWKPTVPCLDGGLPITYISRHQPSHISATPEKSLYSPIIALKKQGPSQRESSKKNPTSHNSLTHEGSWYSGGAGETPRLARLILRYVYLANPVGAQPKYCERFRWWWLSLFPGSGLRHTYILHVCIYYIPSERF